MGIEIGAGIGIASLLATSFTVGGVTVATVGSIAVTVALSGASYLLQSALAPDLAGKQQADEGVKSVIRQSVPSQRLLLGRVLVGGPLFFVECKPPYLYYGILLAGHEIDAVEAVMVGNTFVAVDDNGLAIDPPYDTILAGAPALRVSFGLGTDAQVIDPILAADFPELPATFRQRGCARAVVKMHYGADRDQHEAIWGISGLPNIAFLVRGAKCFDPRQGTHDPDDPSTWSWSDTASLCTARYLMSPRPRLWAMPPLSATRLNMTALAQAANDDEQVVGLASGGTELRWRCSGVIETGDDPQDTLQRLLTANLGTIAWANGQYVLRSGVPRSAVWTFTDDTARGGLEARLGRPQAELLNTMRTRFVSSDREYTLSDGPVYRIAGYVTADGIELAGAIDLPFTPSQTQAQRTAKILIEQSRRGRAVSRRDWIEALVVSAGDVVNQESGVIPQADGTYEVSRIVMADDATAVDVELAEYASEVFAWLPNVDELAFSISPAELGGTI